MSVRWEWLNERDWDWRVAEGIWNLRWTDRKPTMVSGKWQLFVIEPPLSPLNWQNPPGLIANGDIELKDDGISFDICFLDFLPHPPNARGKKLRSAPPPNAIRPNNQQLQSLQQRMVSSQVELYLRVVGLSSKGELVDLPSNSVCIHFGQPPAIKLLSDEELEEAKRKQHAEAHAKHLREAPALVDIVSFTPLRRESPDARYHYIVTQDFPLMGYKAGQKIEFKPKSDSWIDDVGDFFEGAADFVVDATNWVSDAWQDIQSSIVDIAADIVPGCNPECRMVLAGALDIGLAAVGIPPSIPNFDQLMAMGKGYLVENIAAEASRMSGVPVPPEVAEKLVDEVYKQAKNAANHSSGGNAWLRPDPDYMFRPTSTLFAVRNQTNRDLVNLELEVHMMPYFYRPRIVPVPPVRAGSRLEVPLVLDTQWIDAWTRVTQDKLKRAPEISEVYTEWNRAYASDKAFLSVRLRQAGKEIDYTNRSFVPAQGHQPVNVFLGSLNLVN